ncbi:Predicted cobalt transporter in sulfate-reducing delta-proteobacteria [Olavius sp. associated proteobacterium Delta 1]|nr:Predicted cobalt transporter in sulfate-reducing delta-proteobacteria [Olavius sp. associated proteobacterium Delta 1]
MNSRTAKADDKKQYRALFVSLAISLIIILGALILIEGLDATLIVSRLLWPLARLMLFITLGLLIGQIIEASGWIGTMAVLARPLFRFGHLGDHCSAAFTAAFFSGLTANAMLLDFFKEGQITRRQLFLSNFINQLPAFFLHLPTTFFIVIPLTGWAGALYFMITFLAVVLRTILFLACGRLVLPPWEKDAADAHDGAPTGKKNAMGNIWHRIKSRLPQRMAKITVYVVPIYSLVFIFNTMGLFKLLREALAGYVVTSFMPMESLSVIILSFAAEFTSGFAAAGALLEAGVLTIKQTVLALLIGNILAFPVRALRHQLPRYIGIFSPKMGTQLLLLGQGFRVASIILVGIVFYYVA